MLRDDTSNPALATRALIRTARHGALATADHETGAPYASLVAVATAADGAPLLLLSSLARHTMNIGADARVALLVDGAAEDPLAGARVTVSGIIAPTDDPEDRRRFLARHPSAAGYAAFADFRMFRVEPESAHLVAGFGRIRGLTRSDVMTDVSDAGELLRAEEGAVGHMNADHADAVELYATELLGAPPGNWRVDGIDPDGMEISAGNRVLYLPFPQRVRTPGALRQVLVALAEQARKANSDKIS